MAISRQPSVASKEAFVAAPHSAITTDKLPIADSQQPKTIHT